MPLLTVSSVVLCTSNMVIILEINLPKLYLAKLIQAGHTTAPTKSDPGGSSLEVQENPPEFWGRGVYRPFKGHAEWCSRFFLC